MKKLSFVRAKSGDVYVILLGQVFDRVVIARGIHLYWENYARDTLAPNYKQVLDFVLAFWMAHARGQIQRWDEIYRSSSIPVQELSTMLDAFEVPDVKV